jgi:hypothetical protein
MEGFLYQGNACNQIININSCNLIEGYLIYLRNQKLMSFVILAIMKNLCMLQFD